jgi:hypothetical protein
MKIVAQLGLRESVDEAIIQSLYSNELVDCANDFDAKAIREQARNYVIADNCPLPQHRS